MIIGFLTRAITFGRIHAPQLAYTALLVIALSYASSANAETLKFLLLPTATGVSWILGFDFYDTGADGYAIPRGNLLIAPPCAGLRFLIVSSCVGLSLTKGGATFYSNLRLAIVVALSAYALTIVANISRIITIVYSMRALNSPRLVSSELAHLFLGSFTYCLLLALYAGSLGVLYHGTLKRT